MIWNGLLPLGSIVSVKDTNGAVRLQIIGYAQVKIEDSKLYDYAAILYPDGYIDGENVIQFNHEDIEKIYAVGYLNKESREHLDEIKTLLDDVRLGKINLQDKIDERRAYEDRC